MTIPYIPLRNHTAYSLLEGAMTVDALVGVAKAEGLPALGMADTHNMFGAQEFSYACAKAGIQPIIGCLFRFAAHHPQKKGESDQLFLIAKDEVGYGNLLKLMSRSYMEAEELLPFERIAALNEGVIALTAGIHGGIGKALLRGNADHANALTLLYRETFSDRAYMEIMRHGVPSERSIEAGLLKLAEAHHLPLVATNEAFFHTKDMYDAHDALICIAEGRYVMEEDRRRLTPEHRLKNAAEMAALFADLPEALENTAVIARRCAVMSPARNPILPSFQIEADGQVLSEADALRKQAAEGLEERLRTLVFSEYMSEEEREATATPYRARLAFELDVIIQMGFPGYFLIVSDFITWSKQQGIPVGPGRGSGAASVVAWSLLITDLDPLKYDLVFERFLNPERVSMPDFDIDFCQDRRDEVIRYVQQRYGVDRVAQIITFGKLQARAVLRDVGRVLQMPYGQVDKICKLVPANPANPVTLAQALEMEPLLETMREEDETVARLIDMSLKLEGLYRHASTHAAGVVIGDRPLEELVPLYRDTKSDMPVVQYSMKYAEAAGLVKFDFLGLKTLTVLAKAVALAEGGIGNREIEESGKESSRFPIPDSKINLLTIPLNDPATFQLLRDGKTVGVFQFESAGMRDSLRKLQPDRLEDLIALGALYRPGPMDNIPTYIACKHGREKPDYLHPSLKPVLEETYGVIIYQEQVQKIAQVLSGYTLGGADLLRRAMGKKIKHEMDAQRKIFVEGATANNVAAKQANEIFDLVAKFAGYGFNKAHAAAYALIGYQTAYMKANYPHEFMAASMTYDMHNTDKLSIFKQDCEQLGITVLPPDVNASEVEFSVESTSLELETLNLKPTKKSVRYALAAVKNVGAQAMQELVEERRQNGAYSDIFDVFARLNPKSMNSRQCEHLIFAGVFDSIHPNRAELFANLPALMGYGQALAEESASAQVSLFGEGTDAIQRPRLTPTPEWEALEKLAKEYAAIGFYLSAHPLEGYASALKALRIKDYASATSNLSDQYTKLKLAAIVMGRKMKTSSRGRFAFVQLSDASGVYEASIFDETVLDTRRELLETGTLVLLTCDAKADENGARIIIQNIQKLDEAMASTPAAANNHDLTLRITDVKALPTLKTLLSTPANKGTRITLRAPMGNGHAAIITLPSRYDLSSDAMLSLKSMQGVDVVTG
jgi:DNA polymerase III subunit alpha